MVSKKVQSMVNPTSLGWPNRARMWETKASCTWRTSTLSSAVKRYRRLSWCSKQCLGAATRRSLGVG